MKKLPYRLLLMLASLSLLVGALHKQIAALFTGEEGGLALPEGQPCIVLPEGGIPEDAFSLKLFRQVLETSPGNVTLSPAALAQLLKRLQAISRGETQLLLAQQLASLGSAGETSAADMPLFTQLYADIDLMKTPGESADQAVRVPLRADFTQALATINTFAADQTADFAVHMLDGQPLTEETQLIALSAACFSRAWLRPFHPITRRDECDFYNADGSIRPTRMMVCRDALIAAKATDGSWEAVALFFRNEGRKGSPACFVAILPAPGVDARAFARELTAERLADIRRELALAAPRELCVIMPQLQLDTPPFDLQPLLLHVGLGKLFTRTADFSGLSTGGAKLGPVLGKYAFRLDTEAADSAAAEPAAGETLRLNRPFLWFIGDLTTANPPCFMGLMEQG